MEMKFYRMVPFSILTIVLLMDWTAGYSGTAGIRRTAAPTKETKWDVHSIAGWLGKQIVPQLTLNICPPLCWNDLASVLSKIPQDVLNKVTTLCKGSSSQCQTVKNVVEEFKSYPVTVITKVVQICTQDPDVCTFILARLTPLGHLPLSFVQTAIDLCEKAQLKCKESLIEFLSVQESKKKLTQAVKPDIQATEETQTSSQPSKGAPNSSHGIKALVFLNVLWFPLIMAIDRYGI
ncbi:unnamed protein product [Lymnaea stagnalis]|uniref:Uncharacterized protein n=1 Tax=Lymnaea stagnalis TaxID=6523 RepID=A0AAV2IBB3_LYMST